MELETYGTKGCGSYADGAVQFEGMALKDGKGKALDPVDADWTNAPYVQQSESATVEATAGTAATAASYRPRRLARTRFPTRRGIVRHRGTLRPN